MNKNIKKDICVLDFAFQRIGGKYKGRILWALSKHTVMRYGELSREISDISTKMLTQTLRELEMDNLIHREMYPKVPPVSYTHLDVYKRQAKGTQQAERERIEEPYHHPGGKVPQTV